MKEELPYNKLFTDRELKTAIKQKNTASGEYTINPQMIKILLPQTLKYLLDMYNKIWEREKYQKSGNTTITPLLKEEKDVKNYRPKL